MPKPYSASMFWNSAYDFLFGSKYLFQEDIKFPAYHLLGMSFELGAKAFILANGEKNIKIYGHNLECLVLRSEILGAKSLKKYKDDIALLNISYNTPYVLRYPKESSYSLPSNKLLRGDALFLKEIFNACYSSRGLVNAPLNKEKALFLDSLTRNS